MADHPDSSISSNPNILRNLILARVRSKQGSEIDTAPASATCKSDSREPDTIDLLSVVARKTWTGGNADVDDTQTFQVIMTGQQGLNTIRSSFRDRDGMMTIVKSPNPRITDNSITYSFKDIWREISVMERLKHETSIATYNRIIWHLDGPLLDPRDAIPSIESDMSPFGDLMNFSNHHPKASVDVLIRLSQDVTEGLRALHHWGVSHGDIKPQNILVFEGKLRPFVARITDFGSSQFENEVSRGYHGTEGWRPPDWRNINMFGECCEADVFSLGMMLYGVLVKCTGAGGLGPSYLSEPTTIDSISKRLELLIESQKSANFQSLVLEHINHKRRLDKDQRTTLSDFLDIAFSQGSRRSLNECYRVILRHPYKERDNRKSLENPIGRTGIVFGVGPRLDGLPNAYLDPSEAEKVQALSNLRIDIDYQSLTNQNPLFKTLVFDSLVRIREDAHQPESRRCDASFSMAQCYINGFGTQVSESRATEALEYAAGRNHLPACAILHNFMTDEVKEYKKGFLINCLTKVQTKNTLAERELFRLDAHLHSEMKRAMIKNDLEAIHEIVTNLVESKFWNTDGHLKASAIHEAFTNSQDNAAIFGTAGDTLIHYLAIQGDHQRLDTIISKLDCPGMVINQVNAFGWSPALLACKYGHFETLKVLLAAGGVVSTTGLLAETCLHHLSSFDEGDIPEAAKLLFQHNCDATARLGSMTNDPFSEYLPQTMKGYLSPYLMAVRRESAKSLFELFNYATRAPAKAIDFSSLPMPSTDTWTGEEFENFRVPWPNDLIDSLRETLSTHRLDMARICVAFIDKFNLRDDAFHSALLYAIECQTLFERQAIHGASTQHAMKSTMQYIISLGLRRREKQVDGYSILHEVIRNNQRDIFEFLLSEDGKKHVPDVNCQWPDIYEGYTSLQYALLLGREQFAVQLLESGADPLRTASSASGPILSIVAFWTRGHCVNMTLLETLLRRQQELTKIKLEGDVTSFNLALTYGKFEAATRILQASGGKEIGNQAIAREGRAPLGYVVFNLSEHHYRAICYLLDPPHTFGRSSLLVQPSQKLSAFHVLLRGHKARFRSKELFVKENQITVIDAMHLLLEKSGGDQINQRDSTGRTALYYAVSACIAPIARTLVNDYNADVSIGKFVGRGKKVQTPLQKAEKILSKLARPKSRWSRVLSSGSGLKYPPDFYADMPAIKQLLERP